MCSVQVLRRRISAELSVHADDVYLYPSGMSAISKSLQMAQLLNPGVRSVQFGFPYLDALKVQTVFGPGALFFPSGDEKDIDDLERRLEHERFSAVLVEFPGQPPADAAQPPAPLRPAEAPLHPSHRRRHRRVVRQRQHLPLRGHHHLLPHQMVASPQHPHAFPQACILPSSPSPTLVCCC